MASQQEEVAHKTAAVEEAKTEKKMVFDDAANEKDSWHGPASTPADCSLQEVDDNDTDMVETETADQHFPTNGQVNGPTDQASQLETVGSPGHKDEMKERVFA